MKKTGAKAPPKAGAGAKAAAKDTAAPKAASTTKKSGKPLGGKSVKYSKKEVIELFRVFEQHDKDRSGSVTVSELQSAYRNSHLSSFGDDTFKALDKDNSGTITFQEYLRAYYPNASEDEMKAMNGWAYPTKEVEVKKEKHLTQEQLDELRAIFVLYDEDCSGALSRYELTQGLLDTGYDEDEVEDMFEDFDKDGDNQMTFPEFCKMLEDSYL